MQETTKVTRKKLKGKPINVRLVDPLYDQVTEEANKRDMTRSAFIRLCIKHFLLEAAEGY